MKVNVLFRSEMGEGNAVIAIFDDKNCISRADMDRLNESSDDYTYYLAECELNEFDIEDEIG